MSKFESIIQLIIAVLQCFVPRVWRKKVPQSPPTPPLEMPSGELASLPSGVVGTLGAKGGSARLDRGDTITRSVGICLVLMGGFGSLYRLLME